METKSLKIKKLHTESGLLEYDVIKLDNWSTIDEVVNFKPDTTPAYVYCELSATDLSCIHKLEKAGYHFSEFRLLSSLRTTENDYNTKGLYPFKAEIITEKEILDKAIHILSHNSCDDRFSNDPFLKKDYAVERNTQNLRKSFNSWPGEFLLGIFNAQTSELIAFRSGAIYKKTDAYLFQYGVTVHADFNHHADMLEAFTIHYLKEQGVQFIHAVTTGFNIPELNRLTQNHGFKVVSSRVLLRKIFTE